MRRRPRHGTRRTSADGIATPGVPEALGADFGEEEQLLDVLWACSGSHAASTQVARMSRRGSLGLREGRETPGCHPTKWRLLSDVITSMHARPMNAPVNSTDSSESFRWGRVRFVLGMLQMALAVVAMVLLFTAGVTTLSLAAVVLASSFTSLSVMLFGSRRSDRRDRLWSASASSRHVAWC